jgi:hypothetical protein
MNGWIWTGQWTHLGFFPRFCQAWNSHSKPPFWQRWQSGGSFCCTMHRILSLAEQSPNQTLSALGPGHEINGGHGAHTCGIVGRRMPLLGLRLVALRGPVSTRSTVRMAGRPLSTDSWPGGAEEPRRATQKLTATA